MLYQCPRCGKLYTLENNDGCQCKNAPEYLDIPDIINHELLNYIIDKAPKYDKYKERIPFCEAIKNMILKRDDNRCRVCHSDKQLKVHHIEPQGSINPTNLITICGDCHEYVHKQLKKKGYRYFRPR
jgi:5-methylcytosine-specific restriction endonuclease McrA